MRCFIFGVISVVLFCIFVLVPYGIFNERHIIAQVETQQFRSSENTFLILVNEKVEKDGSLDNINVYAKDEGKSLRSGMKGRIATLEVVDSGVVIIQGRREKQTFVYIPSMVEGSVSWRCIGGPDYVIHDSPGMTECKR
jgi:hypothetical protein